MKSRFTSMLNGLFLLVSGFLLLVSSPARALIDFNHNGLSDLWEKQYNSGALFPSTFDPELDLDGDGWTAAEEAAAGTNPSAANSPGGFITPDMDVIPATYGTPEEPGGEPVLLTPETVTLAWPTVPGKRYSVFFTADLQTWTFVASRDGDATGAAVLHAIAITQTDGSIPPGLFFRVLAADQDQDNDRLTDAEERRLGSNPFTKYSDNDYLSDTLEVLEFGSSPIDEDSDDNGVLDHDEPGLGMGGSGGPGGSTFAPVFQWTAYNRELIYDYYEDPEEPHGNATGNLTTYARQAGGPNNSTALSARIPLAELHGKLSAGVPFPSVNHRPAGIWSISGYCIGEDHFEAARFEESQFRLVSDIQVPESVTRDLMVANYTVDYFSGMETLAGIESKSFTIGQNRMSSTPRVFGQDFQPTFGNATRTAFFAPEFISFTSGPSAAQAWDETGANAWYAVGVGGSIDAGCYFASNSEITDLVEIAPATGSGSSISVTPYPGNPMTVKINGLGETPPEGAEVVMRLKASHSTVFARMRVHVFEKRNVPVSIYRIHDSRVPASAVTRGISDATILNILNNAFNEQGNIFFTLQSSITVDLKLHPSFSAPRPLLFSATDGSFPADIHQGSAKALTNAHDPNPAKLSIHVVQNLDRNGDIGVAYTNTCFIAASAPGEVYAHEIGHVLGLATKQTGAHNSHDLGPWPSIYVDSDSTDGIDDAKTGLMYPQSHPDMTTWLRREDWRLANEGALPLQ